MKPTLIKRLSGGADTQFSRSDFKIACQFDTGGFGNPMTYAGYEHYRNRGIRILKNFYDTSTRLSSSLAATGITNLATSTSLGPSGLISNKDLWPLMDMLFMDQEIVGYGYGANYANDTVCVAGNGGVSGATITVSGGTSSGICKGANLSGTGIAAGTYVTNWVNPTITMSQSNAVANGTSVTVSGRIEDTDAVTTAARAQIVTELATNPGVAKTIGAYSFNACGIDWLASNPYFNNSEASVLTTRDNNDSCGYYLTQYWDFGVPEVYSKEIIDAASKIQWVASEKNRMGVSISMFPLLWPYPPSGDMTYEEATNTLEFAIRLPGISGVAFWAVTNTHLPSAAPIWYDDGTFEWVIAIQDFIDKYGLSL